MLTHVEHFLDGVLHSDATPTYQSNNHQSPNAPTVNEVLGRSNGVNSDTTAATGLFTRDLCNGRNPPNTKRFAVTNQSQPPVLKILAVTVGHESVTVIAKATYVTDTTYLLLLQHLLN